MQNEKYFCAVNNHYQIVKMNSENAFRKLPAAVYSLLHCEMRGFYLSQEKQSLNVPKKLFGDIEAKTKKVMHRYSNQDKNLGVLLTGDKGSGKSLLSALIANEAIELGLPVININNKYFGQSFIDFINDIGECCIIFDEFAKVYEDDQDKILTMLEGVMSEKRLIIVNENDTRTLNEFIKNRPGRFFYHYRHGKLSDSIIEEYCQYHGISMNICKQINDIAKQSVHFSIDTLSAIVSEYEMFGTDNCDVAELVADLNIGLNDSNNSSYCVKSLTINDELMTIVTKNVKIFDLNDFYLEIEYLGQGKHKSEKPVAVGSNGSHVDDESSGIYFNERHLKYYNGSRILLEKDGFVLTLELESADLDWMKYI